MLSIGDFGCVIDLLILQCQGRVCVLIIAIYIMITNVLRKIHRFLGIPLSVLFVLWFVSGIVMIFAPSFPRAPRNSPLSGFVSDKILPADSLVKASYLNADSLRSFKFSVIDSTVVATIADNTREVTIDATSSLPFVRKHKSAGEIAKEWCQAQIVRIDTLNEVDQWIPFDYYESMCPIYKFHFSDTHQLYVTADGEAIQFSDRQQRIKAWFGTIPHWLYFTVLRKHQEAWTEVVEWCALAGCLMCLSGIILAILIWINYGRKHGFRHIPYRKPLWRWHFILGLLFGWCGVTFTLSGYMSMTTLPKFLVKERTHDNASSAEGKERHSAQKMTSLCSLEKYKLSIDHILSREDSIISISLKDWEGYPYYVLTYPDHTRNIDASVADTVVDFSLTAEMVRNSVQKKYPEADVQVDLLTEYDGDYYSRTGKMTPLPTIRVRYIGDELNKVEYYNTNTGRVRAIDDNSRRHSFLYGGLHRLNIKFLTDRPWLWWTVMMTLMVGGTALSVTGLLMAIKWACRLSKRKK